MYGMLACPAELVADTAVEHIIDPNITHMTPTICNDIYLKHPSNVTSWRSLSHVYALSSEQNGREYELPDQNEL